MSSLPIIDVSPLLNPTANIDHTAEQIRSACERFGFFYVSGHGVELSIQEELDRMSRQFFALDLATKRNIDMSKGGRAWRGYFAVGEELTSGKPDQKEGLYFGAELNDAHPGVKRRLPLHGKNMFPDIDGFRETLLEYLDLMTQLCHAITAGISASLELERDFFFENFTSDPITLFRIFHYPPLVDPKHSEQWSVGPHTDYGLLTLLRQDSAGGLQVKSGQGWLDAPPIENTFVCNLGDMLERLTGGRYRSTLHQVRNTSTQGRISYPFFFDPNWDAELRPVICGDSETDARESRWDGELLEKVSGTYGEYLLKKISKVFPDLSKEQF